LTDALAGMFFFAALVIDCANIVVVAFQSRRHGRVDALTFLATIRLTFVSIVAIDGSSGYTNSFLAIFVTGAGIIIGTRRIVGFDGIGTFSCSWITAPSDVTFIQRGAFHLLSG
jgi:uncharacterized membrane protein